jgi:glycosyltransferase involved in cell wall biosynthesis
LRILIVTDAWSPQVDGVVRTLKALICELASAGHDVRTIDPGGRPSWPFPFYQEIPLARTSAAQMLREIEAFAPDAIHIATEGPLGWTARNACLRQSLEFTTSFHTRFAEYASKRLPLPGVLSLGWEILRRFHAPSRVIMVPTKSIGKELGSRHFKNIRVWTRGVDRSLFREYSRDHLDLPRPIMLYAGRLAVEKGVGDFLALKVEGSKVLVGDGPERNRLQSIDKAALFLGTRHGEDYARTLAAADVLVFPSRTDTFGLVMIEAMACGTPVAAFDVPPATDVVNDGLTGAVAATLEEAIERASVLDRGRVAEASLRFSWTACAEMFASWLVPCGTVSRWSAGAQAVISRLS